MKTLFLAAALILPTSTLAVAQAAPARKPEISLNDGNYIDGKTALDFNSTKVGILAASKTITIDNLGTASLTGLKLVIDGPGKANFRVTSLPKTSLSPNLSTTFQIRFKPTGEKPVKAMLHLLSNDADEKSFDIKLNGTVGVIVTPFTR